MKTYACRKCGSADLFTKQQGSQIGLYCKDCGAWQKWIDQNEQRLVEEWKDYLNKNTKSGQSSINKNALDEIIFRLDIIEKHLREIKALLGIAN